MNLIKEILKKKIDSVPLKMIQYSANVEKKVDNKVVLERQEIPERWGTMLELFSFMKVFSTNINIFITKDF